ncbi:MAG: hypothetical protein ACRCTK_04430 [Alphaproteobacteria bacterium]
MKSIPSPSPSLKTPWRKRGRPKLEKPLKDLGTLEFQTKRHLLYGAHHPDICKSSPSLDLLYHHQVITERHYEAGKRYYLLSQEAVQGMAVKPTSKSCLANLHEIRHFCPWEGTAPVSAYALRKLKQWRRVENYLASLDPKLPIFLYRVLVEQKLEKKLFAPREGDETIQDIKLLQSGLEKLSHYFQFLPA